VPIVLSQRGPIRIQHDFLKLVAILYCRPTIETMKLTTDRHEASRGLFARAELLVTYYPRSNSVAKVVLFPVVLVRVCQLLNRLRYRREIFTGAKLERVRKWLHSDAAAGGGLTV